MDTVSCSYFDTHRCRSCSLLATAAGLRASRKNEIFLREFSSFSEQGTAFCPLRGPQPVYPSRCRAKLSVSGTLDNPIIGLLDSAFQGIELLHCPLHLPAINSLLELLPAFIQRAQLTPYSISTRQGELKGVVVSCNSDQSEVMLRFILRSSEAIPRIQKHMHWLEARFPCLQVISANIQPIPHQIPEGPEEVVLSERACIWEHYNGLQFAFEPQSFMQVTPQVAEFLYDSVRTIVEQQQPSLVLDLYCGVGGFAVHAAAHCESVIGIEQSQAAVRSARLAAEKAGFANTVFQSGDVDAVLQSLGSLHPDALICNPPRRGLSDALLEYMLQSEAKTIIYSSCNPQSLKRDLHRLNNSYRIVTLAPFDMFPMTEHLEVLAELQRLESS